MKCGMSGMTAEKNNDDTELTGQRHFAQKTPLALFQ